MAIVFDDRARRQLLRILVPTLKYDRYLLDRIDNKCLAAPYDFLPSKIATRIVRP